MSAVAERIDTSEVKLPGHVHAPTVADAPDATLHEHLDKSLDHIEAVLTRQLGTKPDKHGMPPAGFDEGLARSQGANVDSVKRAARCVRAIQQELAEREGKAKRARENEQAHAKQELERLFELAPAKAEEYAAFHKKARAAALAVIEWAETIEMAAGAKRFAQSYDAFRHDVETTARALGKEPPGLPDLEMPDARSIEKSVAICIGQIGHGLDAPRVEPSGYHKADKLVRQL